VVAPTPAAASESWVTAGSLVVFSSAEAVVAVTAMLTTWAIAPANAATTRQSGPRPNRACPCLDMMYSPPLRCWPRPDCPTGLTRGVFHYTTCHSAQSARDMITTIIYYSLQRCPCAKEWAQHPYG